jgi:DNA-directed RNA polymerase specialized sigma24 family protein
MGRPLSLAPPLSDRALPAELDDLITEHHDLLYRTAFGITGNRHDADDVLQSLFVRLLQDELSAELKSNPARWLHQAVVSLSLTVVRVRLRARGEPGEQTATAIARLKPRPLEILLLHGKHDYSDAQIAALLGASRSTIAVTLSRLRLRLREVLVPASDPESTTRESLRELLDCRMPSPSHDETTVSREWIRERVRALPPHLSSARLAEIAAVVSWWRSGSRL